MTDTLVRDRFAAHTEERAAGDSEFTRRFVASTAGIKRDGLDIDIKGISTEGFMNNPVFLWVHDYFGQTLPIGKVTTIRLTKSKMRIAVLFDKDDDFAMEVLRKFDNEFLNAVSIGFAIIEMDRETRIVSESELLDISAVPVPGDPDALMERQRSLLQGVGEDLLRKLDVEPLHTGGVIPGDGSGSALPLIDERHIQQIREITPKDGWRQFEPTGVKVTITGSVDDEEDLLAQIRSALTEKVADFGESIKCPECELIIEDGDLYVPVRVGDDSEVTVAYCVPCGQAKISGEQQETIDTQEGKRMAVKRVERVVAALDEFRSALSDWIDSAGDEDTDESMAALLAAFDGDDNSKGEED